MVICYSYPTRAYAPKSHEDLWSQCFSDTAAAGTTEVGVLTERILKIWEEHQLKQRKKVWKLRGSKWVSREN